MSAADFRRRYESGESILDLSLDAECSRPEMRELLVNAGATIRPKHGGAGLFRHLHSTTSNASDEQHLEPAARIARPSMARWMR